MNPSHSNPRCRASSIACGFLLAGAAWMTASAQENSPALVPVQATLRLDRASLGAGETTVIRAFAQVDASLRSTADRIFSWNIDLLSLDPEVAVPDPGSLVRPVSDKDPVLGSVGVTDGPHLRGIRDSFLELPGAGVAQAVELFSVTLRALAPGKASFRLRAPVGSGGLDPDFLVLPIDDRDAWSGAGYGGAVVTLTVSGTAGGTPPTLRIGPGPDGAIRIEASTVAGSRVAVEESDGLEAAAAWRRVAESAAGAATVSYETKPTASRRFYRAVVLP